MGGVISLSDNPEAKEAAVSEKSVLIYQFFTVVSRHAEIALLPARRHPARRDTLLNARKSNYFEALTGAN
jgi:hypothetical protein